MQSRDRFYKILRSVFTPLFRLLFSPKTENTEYFPLSGAAVIAGNHKHALDPVLVDICTKRVVHTLAKKELHDSPAGWFFRSVGSIPVDLRAAGNVQALREAIRYLQQGSLINISPEGKRNFTGELLLPFKPGAVIMAKKAGCPIIPYAVTGKYRLRSKNLKIRFGKPLDVSEMTLRDANEALFNAVKKLMEE